jgi:hypothetical protein
MHYFLDQRPEEQQYPIPGVRGRQRDILAMEIWKNIADAERRNTDAVIAHRCLPGLPLGIRMERLRASEAVYPVLLFSTSRLRTFTRP